MNIESENPASGKANIVPNYSSAINPYIGVVNSIKFPTLLNGEDVTTRCLELEFCVGVALSEIVRRAKEAGHFPSQIAHLLLQEADKLGHSTEQ